MTKLSGTILDGGSRPEGRGTGTVPRIRMNSGALLAAAVLVCGYSYAADKDKTPEYRFIGEIPVAGDTGWDYLSIDPAARRLYVTHGTHIVVIDLDAQKVVGDIGDTPRVHGFALAPDLGRGFSSNGDESKVSIVDLKSLGTVSKVATQENPDAIVYEPGHKEVYAFNGRGHSATVIGANSGAVVATIPLPGKPEFAAVDPAAGRVYVNIEDKNAILAIDTGSHQVVSTWPIAPGESASGMAFDAANHRLFVGCDNKLMLMVDSTNGKVVSSVPIGDGVDANAFDPQLHLAFSSNGEGNLTIAHEDSPQKLTVVQTVQTQKSARTMALDPNTHRVYVAAATFVPAPKTAPGEPRHRPATVPGSFKILVYGPAQ
jgi:DNA-binding beta-propeller fold protein YncE